MAAVDITSLSNGLFTNPLTVVKAAQNVAEATGHGDEYRQEVAALAARNEAQELYDKTVAERKAIEQMQQKSASDKDGKKSSKKLIIGALAVVAIVIIVVIILKKK